MTDAHDRARGFLEEHVPRQGDRTDFSSEEGIASGHFKPLDPRVAAFGVLGLCNWVAWWYQPDGPYEIDAIVRQITQSAVDMLVVSGTGDNGLSPARSAVAQARDALDALELLLPDDA